MTKSNNCTKFLTKAYLLNTFSPTKALAVQLSGNYRAPLVVPPGRLLAAYGVDVALRQRLLHERAASTLRRASGLFNTRRQHTQLGAAGLTADFQTKYGTRVGYLGFTWFRGANTPASAPDTQPKGDTGGFGG